MGRIRVEARITGGDNLRRLMRKAREQGVHEISAGFYTGQKYNEIRRKKRRKPGSAQRGRRRKRPLAQVAAWQEWGTPTVPERPFMRPVLAWLRTPGTVARLLRPAIDVKTGELRAGPAVRVADILKGKIQQNIRTKRIPPNTVATIRKKGSNDPLIDSGQMLRGVKSRVWWNAPRSRGIGGGKVMRR